MTGRRSDLMASAVFILMIIPSATAAEAATQDDPGAANDEARELINADAVHEVLGYTGEGLSAGIWGFGTAGDHRDLEADGGLIRVDDEQISDHPTHVAGTMAGQGVVDSDQKGVAPGARILSYGLEASSTDDLVSETADSLDYGNVVSQNSWAWTSYDRHGDYDSFSEAYDSIVRGSPSAMDRGISVVFPSANHRNDVDRDYNTIPGTGSTAKNTITVGAVNGNYDMTSFSGWGPTDDGRIKPDVVADGAYVQSTMPGDSYAYKRGTSVSTPAVSGGVVLINDAFKDVEGGLPEPATVKAIMIHTADDISTEGPDYRTGWGVPDMESAVRQVERESSENVVETAELTDTGDSDVYTADFSGMGESKITLVWSDEPGPELVNDLDLEVVSSEGSEFDPWTLDSSDPQDPATKGEDHTNPVEQVEVPDSAEKVEITVEGESLQDSQSYSLVSDADISAGQLADEEEDLDQNSSSDGENSTQDSGSSDSGTDDSTDSGSEGSDDGDTGDDGSISPELDVVTPVKKTYRQKTVTFEADAEDVSEVYFQLNGETYDMKQGSDQTYVREVDLRNGFQTADFTAIGENGEILESSVFFYAIVGDTDDSDTGSSDSENSDDENDPGSEDPDNSGREDEESDNDPPEEEGDDEGSDESSSDPDDENSGEEDESGSDDDSSSDSGTGDDDSDTVKDSDDGPPEIEIVSPEPGKSYSEKTEFKVGFDEEVKSAKLTLNRRATYELEKNGDYYTGSFELQEGLNTMMFMGTDTSGNFNSETMTVRN